MQSESITAPHGPKQHHVKHQTTISTLAEVIKEAVQAWVGLAAAGLCYLLYTYSLSLCEKHGEKHGEHEMNNADVFCFARD